MLIESSPWTLGEVDGHPVLYLNGVLVPEQIEVTVHSAVNEASTATVKVHLGGIGIKKDPNQPKLLGIDL